MLIYSNCFLVCGKVSCRSLRHSTLGQNLQKKMDSLEVNFLPQILIMDPSFYLKNRVFKNYKKTFSNHLNSISSLYNLYSSKYAFSRSFS